MIRLGLCCIFRAAPIRFRTATAAALLRHPQPERLRRLAELCLANAQALNQAVRWCATHGIGAFRINSQILPLITHPQVGYTLERLPDGSTIESIFREVDTIRRRHDIRLTFHPDQFVLLNSPVERVVESSVAELEYQAVMAEWVGADVINIHAGGVYGDKPAALTRLRKNLNRLSPRVRKRLTLENDDRCYSPADLLPICREEGIPLCYDVHHHRCLGDALSIETATAQALATWDREPLFHISSPLGGWRAKNPRLHADYIRLADFPESWRSLVLTVEVEAKAKEPAVLRLARDLKAAGIEVHTPRPSG